MKQRIQRIAKNQKSLLSVCVMAVFLSVMCFVSVSTAEPAEEIDRTGSVPSDGKDSLDMVDTDGNNSQETAQTDRNNSRNAAQADRNNSQDTAQADGNDMAQKQEDLSAEGDEKLPEGEQEVLPAEDENGRQIIFDLDEAVGQAILSQNKNSFWKRECAGEGHKILGSEQGRRGKTIVYALTMYGEYAFHDGYFIKDSGTGIIPAVMKFSYNDRSGYVLSDYQVPTDGSGYLESIHELFPEELWESCISYSEKQNARLTKMEQSYAKKYLKKIGRKAPVGEYSDSEHPLLTDAGVSVEVSNKMCSLGKDRPWHYPDWIGNIEEIEDGVRYVYEMSLDQTAGEIIYTKSIYDTGEVVEQIRFDMYTGDEK